MCVCVQKGKCRAGIVEQRKVSVCKRVMFWRSQDRYGLKRKKLNVTISSLVTTERLHWSDWREKQSFQKLRNEWIVSDYGKAFQFIF